MLLGFGFIFAQTAGEVFYWRALRKDRDEEIKEERESELKMTKYKEHESQE